MSPEQFRQPQPDAAPIEAPLSFLHPEIEAVQEKQHRRASDITPAEVRFIIVQRLRGTSRAVLCERYNLSRAAVRRIESGAVHRTVFESVVTHPATKRLRAVGRSVKRADLIEARKLASEALGMCAHD